ncbi:MAG: class I SAM-dependent methyltransferase [Nanoarchaeota archaeon]|nr:class I SAM-dependent methyltransferase [Nanoarchaeota archaeon]
MGDMISQEGGLAPPATEAQFYQMLYKDHWDWWLGYLRSTDETAILAAALAEIIMEYAGGKESISILDIGSGEGSFLIALLKELVKDIPEVKIDAIEPTATFYNMLRNRISASPYRRHVTAYHTTFEDFPMEKEYDIVLSVNSLFGFNLSQRPSPLEKFKNAITEKGLILVVLPSPEGSYLKIQKELHHDRYPMLDAETAEPVLDKLLFSMTKQDVRSQVRLGIQKHETDTRAELLSLLLRELFTTAPAERRERLAQLLRKYVSETDGMRTLSIVDRIFVLQKGVPRVEPEPLIKETLEPTEQDVEQEADNVLAMHTEEEPEEHVVEFVQPEQIVQITSDPDVPESQEEPPTEQPEPEKETQSNIPEITPADTLDLDLVMENKETPHEHKKKD